jgi:hypothetical protein
MDPQVTQLKVSVKSDLAAIFKASCLASNVSMTSVVSDFMRQYSNVEARKKGYSPDLSTKRQRRAAVCHIITQLHRILDNEVNYRDKIPINFQDSEVFETADQCVSLLSEAMELLEEAY